ncbi:L-asparaginase II [Inquilinus ginsengisoli]|uniref:L-asparaginase II n=1 Tax=Inquilinus ginsengisoli TaxID=363840 RepID=A0ABU1JVR8_9PROT|nr:asparaginase [Inquilinus ginsengisoli]MDR6292698.1 L-asparaginase II [Inquilinus ginsengisoli]
MTDPHNHDHGHDHGHEHGPDHSPASGTADLAAGGGPILVEVTRGSVVESRHRGSALIVDRTGAVQGHWGDIARPVYARSAIKSLQAIPLIESGAFDAFGLGDEELALACSSHNGEPAHVERVAAWLAKIGLSESDLECGAHLPFHEDSAHALVCRHEHPSALHNNCSGKHTGFLTTAVHLGEKTKGYIRYTHPVQQRILGVLEQMTGCGLGAAPWAADGCSIPTIAIPLEGLAFAMAQIADPDDLPEKRRAAVLRIRKAWGTQPFMVAGTGRFDTEIMQACQGRVMTKVGAEGVFCAALPDYGLGVALKIEDGAERAANVAMAAILKRIGALDGADPEIAGRWLAPPIKTRFGVTVGAVRGAAGLAGEG